MQPGRKRTRGNPIMRDNETIQTPLALRRMFTHSYLDNNWLSMRSPMWLERYRLGENRTIVEAQRLAYSMRKLLAKIINLHLLVAKVVDLVRSRSPVNS